MGLTRSSEQDRAASLVGHLVVHKRTGEQGVVASVWADNHRDVTVEWEAGGRGIAHARDLVEVDA